MPSYVIHLATGNKYINKFNNDIKNKEEFLKGVIEPDQLLDNRKAHYGSKKEINSLKKFLQKNEKNLTKDFIKGYFLHLYTDFYMYSKYFPTEDLYEDYYRTNKYIIEKYHVKLPEKLSMYGNYKTGEPQYLTYEFLDNFIDEVTSKTISEIIEKLKGEYDEHKN